MTIKTKLTSRPKLEALKELLSISKMLCHTDKESFVGALEEWNTKWEDFLKERTTTEDGKSHYETSAKPSFIEKFPFSCV